MLRYGARMVNRYSTCTIIRYYRIRVPGATQMKAFFEYLMPIQPFSRLRSKAHLEANIFESWGLQVLCKPQVTDNDWASVCLCNARTLCCDPSFPLSSSLIHPHQPREKSNSH